MKTVDLVKLLDKEKIIIYGAGYIAKRFYYVCKEKRMTGNIVCFASTNGNEQTIDNIPVKSLEQLKENYKDEVIFVAVHESIKDEIIQGLTEHGIKNCIWITPYFYEFLLGEPVSRDICIETRKIWEAYKENYALAARYLAIDQYYGLCSDGYDIYIATMNLINNPETSKKRLDKFIQLLQNVEKNGFDEKYLIYILDNGLCIDGMHRFSIASYLNRDTVRCNIYKENINLRSIHSEGAFISKEKAVNLGLTERKINRLEETRRKICEIYE